MALDQTANFVRVQVSGTHNSTETTISLASGEASNLPDPANGEYNLVWWDDTNNSSPSTDPEVEIVRVTGIDTTNDTITVQRGQEDTTAIAHDTTDATYRMIISNTSKMVSDINTSLQSKVDGVSVNEAIADTAANLPTAGISGRLFFETDTGRTLYDNGTSWAEVGLSESQISGTNINDNWLTVAGTQISLGGSGTPDILNLDGSSMTSGEFLKYDGSSLTSATVDTSWSGITGKPELIEGVTLNEYRSLQNKWASLIAQNQFEVGLSQLGYPDGFYDAFVDNSNISSSSNLELATGSNGEVKLAGDIDSFESDYNGWNQDTTTGVSGVQGTISRDNGSDLSNKDGSYYVDMHITSDGASTNESGEIRLYKTIDLTGIDSISFLTKITRTNSYTNTGIRVGGTFLFNNDGDSGTSEQTVTVDVSGYSGDTLVEFVNEGSDYSGADDKHFYIDIVDYGLKLSSGSLTSTTKSLGYQASEVTLTADYTLNGQTLTPELQDGSGNTIYNFSESEIGDTISISTTATDYRVVWSFSGDGSSTPVLRKYEVGLDDGS